MALPGRGGTGYSGAVVFDISKIFWALAAPGTLIALGLLVGGAAVLTPWRRVRRAGRGLLGFAIALVVAISVLPLGTWLLVPLEERFPAPKILPAKLDGIVVLGGAISLGVSADRGSAQLNQHGERMISFADLARRYSDARLIFTGGSGSRGDQENRESDFAPALFEKLGIERDRIMFERNSRNTHENAVFTKAAARPRDGEVWVLVTSALHMPRTMGVFRRIGWSMLPYPVDYLTGGHLKFDMGFEFLRSLDLVSLGVHEWIGLAAYRLLGWSDRFFPGPGDGGAASG